MSILDTLAAAVKPPSGNNGGQQPPTPLSGAPHPHDYRLVQFFRFDWYGATIDVNPLVITLVLSAEIRAQVREGRPRYGYQRCQEFFRGEDKVATLYHGGNPVPSLQVSGWHCDELVPAIRKLWPSQHYVTRADSAVDLDYPGAFDHLAGKFLEIADELGLTVNHAGDWHRKQEGRTLYIGSRRSAVFLRLYEKGKQPEYVEAGKTNWVRVELVVRPAKNQRDLAAKAQPIDLFGYAVWPMRIAEILGQEDVNRVKVEDRPPSSDEQALKTVIHQYGKILQRAAQRFGSPEELGVWLIQQADAEKGTWTPTNS